MPGAALDYTGGLQGGTRGTGPAGGQGKTRNRGAPGLQHPQGSWVGMWGGLVVEEQQGKGLGEIQGSPSPRRGIGKAGGSGLAGTDGKAWRPLTPPIPKHVGAGTRSLVCYQGP